MKALLINNITLAIAIKLNLHHKLYHLKHSGHIQSLLRTSTSLEQMYCKEFDSIKEAKYAMGLITKYLKQDEDLAKLYKKPFIRTVTDNIHVLIMPKKGIIYIGDGCKGFISRPVVGGSNE